MPALPDTCRLANVIACATPSLALATRSTVLAGAFGASAAAGGGAGAGVVGVGATAVGAGAGAGGGASSLPHPLNKHNARQRHRDQYCELFHNASLSPCLCTTKPNLRQS